MNGAKDRALLRELLSTILEKGLAEPQLDRYAQMLRETDRDVRRLAHTHPNLAQAHIVARLNEDHVYTFAGIPKLVAKALIKYLDITAACDLNHVFLIAGKPDSSMFPVNDLDDDSEYQRIVFLSPSFGALSAGNGVADLFLGHHSRYDLDGLALEVVTRQSDASLRLHLKVADRPTEGYYPKHHYGYVTIETDGTIRYERFMVEQDLRFTAHVSLGVKPRGALIMTHAVDSPSGSTTDLNHLFPRAKYSLAMDLPRLPSFIVGVAETSVRQTRIPGF